MRKYVPVVIFFMLFAFALTCTAYSQDPKRLAVFPFKTGSTIGHWWGGGFDPGPSMAEILTTRLIKSDKYVVLERENLDKIMQEHNLGIAGEVTAETAAEVGRLLGAQYMIFGTVTEFSCVDSGGGGGWSIGFGIGASGSNKGNKKVRVSVNARAVDVNTGMACAPFEVRKEIPVKSGGGSFYIGGTGGGSEGGETIESGLGNGLYEVADELIKQFESAKFKELAAKPKLEGYVINTDGTKVYISLGRKDGIVKGMKFEVTRPKSFKDPRTGETKTMNSSITTIEAKNVDDSMTECESSGTGDPIQANDRIIQK
ncbi:MAG: CsgG/HfaB family protein [Candidatus Eremiobacteraeota bacterium]|nr:CsgG/HfaB family protein [Candidatus Eremiobacteraeota bacterium]